MLLMDRPGGRVELGKPLSLEEYLALPADTYAEIVDGVLRPMSRERTVNRQIGARLAAAIESQLPEAYQVAPEEIVVFSKTPPTARIPDVAVFRDLLDPSGVTNSTPADDVILVVEIVSPTTATADRFEKRAEYARNAIASYWMIETEPDLAVFVHCLVGSKYGEPKRFGPGDTITDPNLPWLAVPVTALVRR